jgi:protein-tyrosine phosphatase
MISVLFVCLGNICRSPTAEGIFRATCQQRELSGQFRIASAGTAGWHVGKPPDTRAIRAARGRDVDLSMLRARQVEAVDFENFDFILAMDESNVEDLIPMRPRGSSAHLHRFLEFNQSANSLDGPDPYYGGDAGFELVLDLITSASQGFLDHLVATGHIASN